LLRLFLSYAHQDAAGVRKLSSDLRRPDIEPWMDDELKLAGVWNDEINERIKGCDFFVPLLSRATQEGGDDRFFRREWQLAFDAKRPFLTVYLEQCELPLSVSMDLKAEMKDRQWAELFLSYEEGLRQILRFLHEKKRTGVFEESFSCLGPDNIGWRLGSWQLDEADITGGNSRSLRGIARLSNTALLPQAMRQTAAITIELPGRPLQLRYRRRLRLSAPVGGEATFRVAIDGEITDTASHSDPAEDEWTTRSVPVPDRGARRVALELTVTASSNLNYFPSGEAWVDDLRIA
jgi:hypothetical protein